MSKTEETEPRYLTAQEVAVMLQVEPSTVYRWASQDSSMPALRIGGVVRFPRERLERWLRDREQGRPSSRRIDPPENQGA